MDVKQGQVVVLETLGLIFWLENLCGVCPVLWLREAQHTPFQRNPRHPPTAKMTGISKHKLLVGGRFGTPWKINGWNLQITHLERKMIFQTPMIMFHVNLPGCMFQGYIGKVLDYG